MSSSTNSLENSNHLPNSLFDEIAIPSSSSSNPNAKTKNVIISSSLSTDQLISRFRSCPDSVRKKVSSLSNSSSCKRFVVNYSLECEVVDQVEDKSKSPSKKRDIFTQKQPVKNTFVGGGASTIISTETATTRVTPRKITLSPRTSIISTEMSENKGAPASPAVVASSSPRNNNINILTSFSPEFRVISSDLQKNQTLASLLHVQKTLHALEYNFLPLTSFFDLRKRRSVRAIFETAKEMLTCSLPIRCLEAVFLSLFLTVNLKQVTRFPISMTSCGLSPSPATIDDIKNNSIVSGDVVATARTKYFKHIVLGISVAIAKNANDSNINNDDDEQSAFSSPKTDTLLSFGTLGLSRRSCLMDKPLFNPEYSNCLNDLLLKEFATSYNSVGHRLVSVRLGLPFPHDTFARNIPCWIFLELFSIPPQKMIENNTKKSPSFISHIKGSEMILAKMEEENRQVLQIFQSMINVLGSDYLKFIELFPESRGSCVRVLEKRAANNVTAMMGGIKVNRYGIPVSNESSSSASSSPLSPPTEAQKKDKNIGNKNPTLSPRVTPKTKQNDNKNNNNNPNSYPYASPTTSPSHHRNADTDVLGMEILESIHTKYFSSHPLHTRQHQESRKLLKIILELCDEHQKQIPSYDDGGEGEGDENGDNALEQGENDDDEEDDDDDEQEEKNETSDPTISFAKQCKKKPRNISAEATNDEGDEENSGNSNNISMEQLQKSFKENRFRIECLLRGVSPYKVAMGLPLPSKTSQRKTTAASAGGIVIPKPPPLSSSSSSTASPQQQNLFVVVETENEIVSSSFPPIDADRTRKNERQQENRSATSSRSGSSNSVESSPSTKSPTSNSSSSSSISSSSSTSSPTANATNHLPFLPPIHRNNNNKTPSSAASSNSTACAKQNLNTNMSNHDAGSNNNTFSVTSSRQPTPMMPKNNGFNMPPRNNHENNNSDSAMKKRMKILESLGRNNDEEVSTYRDDFELSGEIKDEEKSKEGRKKSKKSNKKKKLSKNDDDEVEDDDESSRTPERKMATLMPRKSI